MTKADLVEEVSRVTELTRKDSEVIVDTLFDSVIKALKTGEKVEVLAKRVPYFKPSKELKDLINDGTSAPSTPSEPSAAPMNP